MKITRFVTVATCTSKTAAKPMVVVVVVVVEDADVANVSVVKKIEQRCCSKKNYAHKKELRTQKKELCTHLVP